MSPPLPLTGSAAGASTDIADTKTPRQRALIVATTFYPDPMVGSVRMTQWARHLPSHGWDVMVMCRHYGHQANADDLAANVHPAVTVEYLNKAMKPIDPKADRRRTTLAGRLKTNLSSVASGFLIPDVSAAFWRRTMGRVRDAIERHRPDVIITTSPQESTHLVGLWATRTMGLPWVADFREAFIADPRYRPTGVRQVLWPFLRAFERDIYQEARLVIHQLPIHDRWARLKYPFARSKCREMINGFSPHLCDGTWAGDLTPSGRKSVRLIGTFGKPEAVDLARAMKVLIERGRDLELRFIGGTPVIYSQVCDILGEDRVVVTGVLKHDMAMRQLLGADVLVNCLDAKRRTGMIVSTKLIEFIAARRPTIEINPTFSDRMFAKQDPDVQILSDPTIDELAAAVERALGQQIRSDTPMFLQYYAKYSWPNQVARLASWLNELAGASTPDHHKRQENVR